MNIRKLLRERDLRPEKGLGQNFLVEQAILEKIVAAAELTSEDVVLEIGAGTGALTQLLAQDAGDVIAVELDQRLIPILQEELSEKKNVTLIQGDILKLEPADLFWESDIQYKVVANLPYYITSAVLRHLLEATLKPKSVVITVQREVAERIVAEPGDMSVLTVSVQFYGKPEVLFYIKPGSFYPSPEVESAVLRIDIHDELPLPQEALPTFFRIVRAGFAQRRKQLHNTLSAGLGSEVSKYEVADKLKEAGVDPRRRAQTLDIDEWVRATSTLSELLDSQIAPLIARDQQKADDPTT